MFNLRRSNGKVRLSKKEIRRQDNGFTVVVRPHDGFWNVAAVQIEDAKTGIGRIVLETSCHVKDQISSAIKEIFRTLDKCWWNIEMFRKSRKR